MIGVCHAILLEEIMKLFSQLWERALLYLEEDLNTFQFNVWIKELKPVREEGDNFYFEVSTLMQKNLMNEKYSEKIKAAMQMAYEDILDISNPHITPYFLMESEYTKLEEKDKEETEEKKKINYRNIPLDPNNTFDTFVVGECNHFANQMAINVAQAPGRTYNPLFLYGGPSLGKTHLIHAIGNYILDKNPDAKIVYVSSETFMNELISMLRVTNNKMEVDVREQFRNRYRKVDILLVDDIQFLAGKDFIQDEFFHTFNALHQLGKQIVISSDKPPHELQKMEQRLLSRFEWGITVDIKPPDYETRTAILMRKAQLIVRKDENILPIQNEVYHYIASKITTDIRKLEGALRKVIMYAEFNRDSMKLKKIDLSLAEKALENYLNDAKPKVLTPSFIIDMVCRQFNIKSEEIKGKQKNREFAYPRQIAMYILRNITELPYIKIAELFEKKDHTTVIYAVDKITQQMEEDIETKNIIEDLIMRIKQ